MRRYCQANIFIVIFVFWSTLSISVNGAYISEKTQSCTVEWYSSKPNRQDSRHKFICKHNRTIDDGVWELVTQPEPVDGVKISNIIISGATELKLHSVCMETISISETRNVITYHDQAQREEDCSFAQKLILNNTKGSTITRNIKDLQIVNSQNQKIKMEKKLGNLLVENSEITELSNVTLSSGCKIVSTSIQNVKGLTLEGSSSLIIKDTYLHHISKIIYNSSNSASTISDSTLVNVKKDGVTIYNGKVTFDNVSLSNLPDNALIVETGGILTLKNCIIDNVAGRSIEMKGGNIEFDEVAWKSNMNKTFSFTMTQVNGIFPLEFTLSLKSCLAFEYGGIGLGIGTLIGLIISASVYILYTKYCIKTKQEENILMKSMEQPQKQDIDSCSSNYQDPIPNGLGNQINSNRPRTYNPQSSYPSVPHPRFDSKNHSSKMKPIVPMNPKPTPQGTPRFQGMNHLRPQPPFHNQHDDDEPVYAGEEELTQEIYDDVGGNGGDDDYWQM